MLVTLVKRTAWDAKPMFLSDRRSSSWAANTKRYNSAGLMLAHHLGSWSNSKPELGERLATHRV